MDLTPDKLQGLDIALNEATLVGAEVDPERRIAAVTLALLTLPESGPPPDDPRVQLILQPVGRVAASLRRGRWDDRSAPVEPFALNELLDVVQSFKQGPIYGWEFFDVSSDEGSAIWEDRLSFDERFGDDGNTHTLTLFQETFGQQQDRHLDICIWFDDLTIFGPERQQLDIDEVIAGGKRWWDGLFSGDTRSQEAGIYPLKEDA